MATLKDIAQESGVSYAAVSYILNNTEKSKRFNAHTREKVKKIATQQGYFRNDLASQIVKGKSNVIAYLSNDLGAAEYSAPLLSGIITTAEKSNYYTKLFHFDYTDVPNSVRRLMEQRPAGVICRAITGDDYLYLRQITQKYNIPVVSLNETPEVENGLFTVSDDKKGIALAVQHLYDLGHERIAFLGKKTPYGLGTRCEGFIETVQGISKNLEYTIEQIPKGDYQDIKKVFNRLNKKFKPSAISCGSDYLAMGILRAAHESGMKLPGDLSVTGFSDLFSASFSYPPLTTIRHIGNTGSKAAELLISALQGKISTDTRIIKKIPVKLIIRGSTTAV